MKKLTFKTMAVFQTLVVVGVFAAWWAFRTTEYLGTPIRPSEEVYAHNWGFQCMVGAIYLVGLLAISAFVLSIERWIYGFFQPKR